VENWLVLDRSRHVGIATLMNGDPPVSASAVSWTFAWYEPPPLTYRLAVIQEMHGQSTYTIRDHMSKWRLEKSGFRRTISPSPQTRLAADSERCDGRRSAPASLIGLGKPCILIFCA
jgi:hypothetical protein